MKCPTAMGETLGLPCFSTEMTHHPLHDLKYEHCTAAYVSYRR